ncbi:MAG: T9SS type A sorting domain-containing protein, partial [Bacteroidota bacterium]
RLKQVDYDGTFAYSPVVEVELAVPGGYRVEGVYPNPMRGRGQVRFVVEQRQRVTVSVYDVLGRRVEVVWSGMAEAGVSESVEVGVSGWPSGSYVVRVEGERFAETQRVVVVR